jgi:streptomycin 6-kinase
MSGSTRVDVPDAFAASYGAQGTEARAWIAHLPQFREETAGVAIGLVLRNAL